MAAEKPAPEAAPASPEYGERIPTAEDVTAITTAMVNGHKVFRAEDLEMMRVVLNTYCKQFRGA